MAPPRTHTRAAAPALLSLLQAACAPGHARAQDEEWKPGLKATHYWDCNGQGCDATVLKPYRKERFVSSPQYAPADPQDFGGPKYGEKLWLTGAASDALARELGRDAECCGSDKDSGGCGRCLLVRNPTAVNYDWLAVVMKKSRCPPESKGCDGEKVHLDIAAPGYDNITVSTANVCGKSGYTTYITKNQSGVCAGTHGGCTCEGMPNETKEEQVMKQGCILFGTWGWKRGDPTMEWKPVACPEKFVERIHESFNVGGVVPLTKQSRWLWVALVVAVVLLAVAACIVNRILEDRREKKEAERRKKKKELREKERLKGRNFGGQHLSSRELTSSDEGSSSASSSSASDDDLR